MKLNVSKLLRIAGHVIVAAPVIVAAVKPALSEFKKPKATGS